MTTVPEGPPSWVRKPGIWKYGGATDKRACATELEHTYAYQLFDEFCSGLGSAYSRDTSTLVGCESLAVARSFAALWRAAERLEANSLPVSAHESLAGWVDRLRVTVIDSDNVGEIRAACAAKFQIAVGPTATNEDDAIRKLLGAAFVRVWRQVGVDIATPPTLTYWPTINPGPAARAVATDSLGNPRTWLSERENLVVEVQQPSNMSTTEFLRLVNVRLYELLNDMLPSTATFTWAVGPLSSGFSLDVSQLDYGGLTP